MKYKAKQVRNLKAILRDMKPFVQEDARFLKSGRKFRNFDLLPREVWANWLLCAVGNFHAGAEVLTFAEDPTGGDGLIVEKKTSEGLVTEHVYIVASKDSRPVEDLVAEAVAHKMRKGGKAYAQGKYLIIFSDAVGEWTPTRAAKRIVGSHAFSEVWVIALESAGESGYAYNVSRLDISEGQAPVWRVAVKPAFDGWTVQRVQ